MSRIQPPAPKEPVRRDPPKPVRFTDWAAI